jgi:hypothetical protein
MNRIINAKTIATDPKMNYLIGMDEWLSEQPQFFFEIHFIHLDDVRLGILILSFLTWLYVVH